MKIGQAETTTGALEEGLDMKTFKLSSIYVSPNLTLYQALSALLLACSGLVYAEEWNHEVEVTEQGGVYHIRASAVVDAPAEYVHQALTDFIHIYRLNPSIIESEVIATDDD